MIRNILLFHETDDGLWQNPVELSPDDLPNGIPRPGDWILDPVSPQVRNCPPDHQIILEVQRQIIDPQRPYAVGLIVSESCRIEDELVVIEAFRKLR